MKASFAAFLFFTFLRLSISAQTPDIIINSILPSQTVYCTGNSISIDFATSNFSGSNSYTAQMSKSGFVSDSINLGSVTFSGNQSNATIAYMFQNQDADADSAYQLRIRSGNTVSALFPSTPFYINARPVAVASVPSQTVCSGVFFSTVSFSTSNNVPNTTYSWSRDNTTNVTGPNSGTGNIAATYLVNNTTTDQTVTYTIIPTGPAPAFCTGNAITATILVKPAPTVTVVSADTVCSGTGISLSLSSNVPALYYWYADDNVNTSGEDLAPRTTNPIRDTITNLTSAEQIVSYNVIATSTTGNCQGAQQIVYITVLPKSRITNDTLASLCSGTVFTAPITSDLPARYTWKAAANSSVTGETTVLQTSDTISDTLVNTTAVVQTVVYTITATIDSGGCAANPHTLQVRVYPNPVANFTIANPIAQCERVNSFRFSATTSAAITNYNWTFGSPLVPSNDTGSLLIRTFTGTGDSIPVKLVTTTSLGCADSVQKSITIYPGPDADFTFSANTPCSGDSVSFGHLDNTNTSSLIWIWGDGTANSTCTGCTDQKHRYSSTSFPSSRNMQLVAVSPKGCKDTSSMTIQVKPNPDANFSVNDNSQCLNFGNHQFVFTDKSTIADSLNNSLSYLWNFGDASPVQTTKDASHTYATPDSFFVYHSLVTAWGCGDSISKLMVVYRDPSTGIKNSNRSDTLCGGTTITLTADSGYTYLWSNTKTTRSITVRDSVLPNPYTVNYAVTVTDNHLCTATAAKEITVNPAPSPTEIKYDTSLAFCAGAKAQLFRIVNPADATYLWSSQPDVMSSSGYLGPLLNVDLPGLPGDTFSVFVLAIDNQTGCVNSDTAVIYLSQSLAPVATIVRDLLTLLCTNNTAGEYQWGYDDANLQEHDLNGETLQSYYVGADPDAAVSGKYYWVKITDEGGCQSKIYYQSPPSYFTGILAADSDNLLLRIYPNPVQEVLSVNVRGDASLIKAIEVCNTAGQIVFRRAYHEEMTIDAGKWKSGMYFLKVKFDSGIDKTYRVIKL